MFFASLDFGSMDLFAIFVVGLDSPLGVPPWIAGSFRLYRNLIILSIRFCCFHKFLFSAPSRDFVSSICDWLIFTRIVRQSHWILLRVFCYCKHLTPDGKRLNLACKEELIVLLDDYCFDIFKPVVELPLSKSVELLLNCGLFCTQSTYAMVVNWSYYVSGKPCTSH